MGSAPYKFHVESGAVDVAFRKNPDIRRTDTVFVSHILVSFGEALSTAEPISLVYNSDETGFQNMKIEEKELAVGADHATFEFETPFALNCAELQVLFANTDGVSVNVVFIHNYR